MRSFYLFVFGLCDLAGLPGSSVLLQVAGSLGHLRLDNTHKHTHTHTFVIHSSVVGHLPGFLILVTVNVPAVNMGVQISF